MLQEIHQQVIAQVVAARQERATTVQRRHLLHELPQVRVGVEHERVDRDVVLRAAHGLTQRGLHRQLLRLVPVEVGEPRLAVRRDVRRGFAVGDHDDLLVPVLARQHLARHPQRVVHVGALHPRDGRLHQLVGLDLPRHVPEHQDAQVIARIHRRDERLQRHRHLLGRAPAVVAIHRVRRVEHEHRGRTREVLGALDLEILRRQPHRRALAPAIERVANGALQIEVERIAVFVLLGVVRALVPLADGADGVLAQLVLGQPREQIAQRLRPDLAHALGRDLDLAFLLADETLALELLHELRQLVHRVGHVVAHEFAHAIHVGLGQLLR